MFLLGLLLFLAIPTANAQSVWQEPTCDPDTDPTLCNVAAPLNVSGSDQTKAGSLTINGTLQATSAFTFSGSAGSFSVTNDSITDAMARNDITSGKFIGSGSSTDAVDLGSAEVSGTLPASSVTDVWVNTTGDTMTGTLDINTTNRGIAIQQTSTTAQESIYIQANAASTGVVLKIDNASVTSTAYPIDLRVISAARRAINIDQAASSGIGVYSYTTGPTSTGVYGYANSTTGRGIVGISGTLVGSLSGPYAGIYGESFIAGAPGVYGTSTVSNGVRGETSSTNSDAVYGFTSATGSIGVHGDSVQSIGVFGSTASLDPKTYGIVGCNNSKNCGKLGGMDLAGEFDGRVAGADFLPLEEERFGNNSFRTSGKWASMLLNGVDWQYANFIASDGEEVWINLAHPANPNTFRINAAMLVQNRAQSFGSIGFEGATIGPRGLVMIRNSDGEICVWEKDAASSSCPGTPDPDLEFTKSLWFDGTYYWAGRTGGRGITRFDNTFTLGASVQTVGANGSPSAAIIDFTQDEKAVYALEDDDTSVSPSATRILVIDRTGNSKTTEYTFNDYELNALEFDGQFIWATAISNTGQDGLMRIDPVTGGNVFLDFSTPYPVQFDLPKDLVFDGTYLWVILQNSFMLARISPVQADIAAPKVVEDDFVTFSYAPQLITFDGEAVWVLVNDTSGAGTTILHRIFSGKGYGYQTTTVFPQEGISLWDYTTGAGTCIRVESGKLAVYSGALCN